MELSTGGILTEEAKRLLALEALDILDTPAEQDFDELARVAAISLSVASAGVSLIDTRRQWFKARHGIPFEETPREIAFCDHALRTRDTLIVADASADPRFQSNPLVTQDGGIRFYAGAPLITSSGHCLGTLCVFDPRPRPGFSPEQRHLLQDLARVATDLIESRKFRRMGEIAAKVVEATSDAVVAADWAGTILYWNPAAERLFGRRQAEVIGKSIELMMPARFGQKNVGSYADLARLCSIHLAKGVQELTAVRADGSEFPAELSLAQWRVAGEEQGFAVIVRDVSARKSLERDREQSEAFLSTIVSNLPSMLFVKDAATREYLMVNKAGLEMTGRSAAEMIGSTDRELFPRFGRGYEQRDKATVAAGSPQVYESIFRRDDGTAVHLRTTRTLIDGPDRPNQYILGVSEDVTVARLAEREVLRLAQYDVLTGLLNRASFTERLYRLIEHQAPFALLSVDLDRFKAINDQFGHLVGDQVLEQVAERLRSVAAPSDWIARVGGDEFIMVLLGDRMRERAHNAAVAVATSLAEPFTVGHAVAHAGASVGVVIYPDDGGSPEQVRENADLALYRAKAHGRGSVCFFNAKMDDAARDRRKLETDLRHAVESGLIGLAYQPVLCALTGQLTSVEALARWTHPERGPIPPSIFIPLAEECGLIDQLASNLLRIACINAMTWPPHVRVAVNLSPLQFLSGQLSQTLRLILDETGLPAGRLQLEVTEGLVIRDVNRTFEQLKELRAMGIQILMDDFGIGYSSLSYFQRFPFDKVKIDKSFVDEITTSPTARAIIEAIVGLGRALGMSVVAEGVETEAQMQVLIETGCTHLQGYLISHPVSAATITTFSYDRIGPPDELFLPANSCG